VISYVDNGVGVGDVVATKGDRVGSTAAAVGVLVGPAVGTKVEVGGADSGVLRRGEVAAVPTVWVGAGLMVTPVVAMAKAIGTGVRSGLALLHPTLDDARKSNVVHIYRTRRAPLYMQRTSPPSRRDPVTPS